MLLGPLESYDGRLWLDHLADQWYMNGRCDARWLGPDRFEGLRRFGAGSRAG